MVQEMENRILREMKYLILLLSFFSFSLSFSQQGWDWGTDKQLSQQKWFNVVTQVKQKNYQGARSDLNWLLTNTPRLNVDLYKQASKVYQTLEKTITDAKTKQAIQDSALWVYDARLTYFGDSANVLNRKGLYAYKYKSKDKKTHKDLFGLYAKIYQLNGYKAYMYNTLFYMDLASKLQKEAEIDENSFIGIYNQLVEYSEEHILKETKENTKQNYIKNKAQIDAIFEQSLDMTCDKIKELYGVELAKDSVDLAVAKKVFLLLAKAKCTDKEMYERALTIVNDAQPSTNGYIGLADYYQYKKDYNKVEEMYTKALDATTSKEQKGEVYFELAKKAKAKKQLSKAREYALQTISSGVYISEAYNLIGDLYMYSSYEKCETSDVVISRSVYLAAYDMYEKAGNSVKMEQAKKQFPSDQEVFFTNRKIGDVVNTGCWINKAVVIRRR